MASTGQAIESLLGQGLLVSSPLPQEKT